MFMKLFLISFLVIVNLPSAKTMCFFNCDEPKIVQPKPALFEYFNSTLFEFIVGLLDTIRSLFNWIIFKKSTETIFTISVIIIFILNRKGRHRQTIDSTNSTCKTNATASNVNSISALHFNMEQRSNPNNVRSSLGNLNEIKIALLTEDSCLQNWMAILEHNLKRKEKHEWVEIALTHMNEKIISKLKNLEILLNSSNGFEQLKNQLVNIFNSSTKPFGRPKSLNDFKTFFERNQQPNYRIKTMLTEAFPKPKIEFFEDVLKQRYVKGLNNTRLREKFGEKLKNSTQINLVFSNDQNNFEYEKRFQSRRYQQHWNLYNRNKAEFDLNQGENLQVLTGTAIFNNTLASFSFDSRVGSTLTNESLYVRIKKEDPKTVLEPYNGKPIYLCDKQLYVYGQVHLRKCQLSKNFLDNELIIVTNHKSNYECVIGRNLMKKIHFCCKSFSKKNVPKLIGNYENELMSSNQNFYKRENPKGVTANYLSKNVYLKSKNIKPEKKSKRNKNHISNRIFTNRKYFQENKNPKVSKQNIFLNKNKPENSNTQPKKGEGGSVRDKQNQNQSKINEINLNIHFNKEKPSFDKNELKEFRQRKQIEMEKIQPIDFDNEYSNYSDQESDRLSTLELFNSKKHIILKIMRNKEIHEIKTDEYIKLVSNKKSTEIESKKKMLEIRNESLENRFKHLETALARLWRERDRRVPMSHYLKGLNLSKPFFLYSFKFVKILLKNKIFSLVFL